MHLIDFSKPPQPQCDFSRPPSDLLTPGQLHEYQRFCVDHIIEHSSSMLWLDMGLGKTIITLSAIIELKRLGLVNKVLIWGPVRVIQSVWNTEARKWSHTKGLRFSIIHGLPQKRERAIFADADIFLCNYENMNWLAQKLDHYFLSQGKPLPYEMAVYDEVSKVKDTTSLRIAGGNRERKGKRPNDPPVTVYYTPWRKFVNMFRYRVGLTGTPAPNGYIDLLGQYLVVDGGQRLGERITHYRDSYFESDFMGYKYTATEIGKQMIEKRISDITVNMNARDYLDLPDVTTSDLMVELPATARKHYKQLEADLFTALDSGHEVELFNRGSLSNKLLQICNGQVYIDQLNEGVGFEPIHVAKLDALESVLEEAGGQPVLCSYSFRSDAERIMEKFKKYKPVNLTAEPSTRTSKIISDWQAGRIKLMIGHPASMGHGIDGLQKSGSIIVWFGINWSLELYNQMIARLDRQGQERPVKVIRILCDETIDLMVSDAIEMKATDQDGLKRAMQRYRDRATSYR